MAFLLGNNQDRRTEFSGAGRDYASRTAAGSHLLILVRDAGGAVQHRADQGRLAARPIFACFIRVSLPIVIDVHKVHRRPEKVARESKILGRCQQAS